MLLWAIATELGEKMGRRVTSIPKRALEGLQRYSWPGNVRELRNVVERALILANGPRLTIDPPQPAPSAREKSLRIADVEATHIRAVLDRTGWRVRGAGGAAELLGVKPTTLEGRMAKLGIRRAHKGT